MGKKIAVICALLSLLYGVSEAQVNQGTVFSKTEDGNGNKITSTVTGPSRGLDINCLAGCAGAAGGGTSSTYGAAFPATGTAAGFSDGVNMRPGFAVDLDTGAAAVFGQGVNLVFRANGGAVEAGTALNPWNVTGTVAATQSGAWTVAATQSGVWSTGRTWTLSSGTDSVLAAQTGAWTVAVSNAFLLDATFTGRINTLGQKTMANSTPFVIASDQTSIPVAATVTNSFLLDATFTGRFAAAFASADNIAAQTSTFIHGGCMGWDSGGGNWDRCLLTAGALNVSVQNATLAVTQSGVWSTGRTWTLASGTDSVAVSNLFLLEATFTGRINTQGQKTMAASTPVVLPSDQAAIPVTVLSTVASANNDGSCASGAATFTALASNASRTWAAVWASPANTDDVYIKLGATATNADARFSPGQALNFTSGRIYTGVIDAFPASGTQAVCVMELN